MFATIRKVKATWGYAATKSDELSFIENEIILILNENRDEFGDWAEGQLEENKDQIGWFPLAYVEPYTEQPSVTEIRAGEIYRLSVDEVDLDDRTRVVDGFMYKVFNYSNQLEYFLKKYAPLVKVMVGMTEKEKKMIFGHVFLISSLLNTIYEKLGKVAEREWTRQRFGRCLLKLVDNFADLMHKYYISHPVTVNTFSKLMNDNKNFQHLVNDTSVAPPFITPEEVEHYSKFTGLSFFSFLYAPIEFAESFALSVKELALVTPDTHIDKPHINKSVKIYQRLIKGLQSANSLVKIERNILATPADIDKFPPTLLAQLSTLQYFTKAISIDKKKQSTELFIMVYLNYLLIMTSSPNPNTTGNNTANTNAIATTTSVSSSAPNPSLYSLKYKIPMDQLSILPAKGIYLEDNPHGIIVSHSLKLCVIVSLNTEREKQDLIDAMDKSIQHAKGPLKNSHTDTWINDLTMEAKNMSI